MKFLFYSGHTTLTQILLSVWHRKVLKSLLRGLFFCLIKNNSALMQTFSLPCFSSSNRVGGVAHDCVEFALRCLFPWLQAPFCFRSVIFRLCRHVNMTTRKHESARKEKEFRRRRPRWWVCPYVHLFNSGLYSTWWRFYNRLRLSYFPLAFRLFPPWGINQNLSERKIKTRPYWIWSGFVLYSMHGY